jgi:ribulose-phosphate 3-epimerase
MNMSQVEIVPAILRRTREGIEEDWNKVVVAAQHIQIDITDGVFAGEGTFHELKEFKKLPQSEKIELHLMVHNPGKFVDDIIDLNPARVAFHIEAFADGGHIDLVYKKLRQDTASELGLAINPITPLTWLEEQLPLIDYVLFLGVNPGWSGQNIVPTVFQRISQFQNKHPTIIVAIDGGVNRETISDFAKAGATIFCAGSAIFKTGDPVENINQLRLAAESAVD